MDDTHITTAGQPDAALAAQRSNRLAKLGHDAAIALSREMQTATLRTKNQ